MIRAVISDIGGVILWFDNNIFLRKLAEQSGLSFDQVKAAVHYNLEFVKQFDSGELSGEEFHARVVRVLGIDIPLDIFIEIYSDIFSLNRPVLDLLTRIKEAGYRTVLLSNVDPVRFGFIRKKFPELLIFDTFAASCELKLMKPDPAIYRKAAHLAGVRPEECVFIDDMEENVRGAEAEGLHGIIHRPETDLESELKKLNLAF